MKFTRPLYRELFALGGDTRVIAVNTFKERASFYHPICRTMVAKDLMVDLGERGIGYFQACFFMGGRERVLEKTHAARLPPPCFCARMVGWRHTRERHLPAI